MATVPKQLTLAPGEQVVEVIPPGIFMFKVVALAVGVCILALSLGNFYWSWQKFERAEAKHQAGVEALEREVASPPAWMKDLSPKRMERERKRTRTRLLLSKPSFKQSLSVPVLSLCFSLLVLGVIMFTGKRPPKAIVVTNQRAFISHRKEDTSVPFASVASLAADSHGVGMGGVAGAINRSMADAAQQTSQLSSGYWSRANGIFVHFQDGTTKLLDRIPPSGLRRLGPAMAKMVQQHQQYQGQQQHQQQHLMPPA